MVHMVCMVRMVLMVLHMSQKVNWIKMCMLGDRLNGLEVLQRHLTLTKGLVKAPRMSMRLHLYEYLCLNRSHACNGIEKFDNIAEVYCFKICLSVSVVKIIGDG